MSNVASTTVFSAQNMNANANSSAVDASQLNHLSFQAVWSVATGTIDGTCKLQFSNEATPTNWTDEPSTTFTFSGAAGSNVLEVPLAADLKPKHRWYRLAYTKTGITGGSLTATGYSR
jgi:hypothetical protein